MTLRGLRQIFRDFVRRVHAARNHRLLEFTATTDSDEQDGPERHAGAARVLGGCSDDEECDETEPIVLEDFRTLSPQEEEELANYAREHAGDGDDGVVITWPGYVQPGPRLPLAFYDDSRDNRPAEDTTTSAAGPSTPAARPIAPVDHLVSSVVVLWVSMCVVLWLSFGIGR